MEEDSLWILSKLPEQCQRVLQDLGQFTTRCAGQGAGALAEARLWLHQQHSQKIMDELKAWMHQQLDQKLVEPNSGWVRPSATCSNIGTLTLFLRQAGAPWTIMSASAVSRWYPASEKLPGYKTQNGAVGRYVHEPHPYCRLCAANPLDYLCTLQRHARKPSNTQPSGYPGITLPNQLADQGEITVSRVGAPDSGQPRVTVFRPPHACRSNTEIWRAGDLSMCTLRIWP